VAYVDEKLDKMAAEIQRCWLSGSMKTKLKASNPNLRDDYILESECPRSYSCDHSGVKVMTNIPSSAIKNIKNSGWQFTPEKRNQKQILEE
jgi:hypothetical protein